MSENPTLILIVGPTAVGKTDLCLKLAKNFNTEIISCDSRQFYRELSIGTAKPTSLELAEVKHHLIDSVSISEDYDVKKFESDALRILEDLFSEKSLVIMTGGSGLFAKAITDGLDDMPDIPDSFRKMVIRDYQENGLEFLQEELKNTDPEYFSQVDIQNPQRLMRALEVIRGTGKPFSSFRKRKKVERPFRILKIALERDREELYQRIDQRMDQMIVNGLFEEAKQFFEQRHLNALQTVGYQEIFGYLEGKYDREEAIRLLKRNSRRYAKRQLTWFRKESDYQWFHPDYFEQILKWINIKLAESH
ncbi:tRNA (adenosine(37)-N6)-dimethylallyltransferase MiaA [Algoriphagus sp. NF]|uniref:tRNA (adenosine(37)-N6)-dimethylallyltransferase MiaA n=1 Tax=Algoriphagus sp. NF TaxID=2992756 RepID=UPI00237B7EB6|nr:tRNA (adenosine(37)-N6)-dimethylallyltransferase MiaA [Algoriphagus sp. NF]MDE0558857.1 tRNA (adenosine(37)-N6)-dimethylallyltransferase MiaA [Algoriphagus sp. NF]